MRVRIYEPSIRTLPLSYRVLSVVSRERNVSTGPRPSVRTHTHTGNDNATTRARSTSPHWPDISNFLPGHWRRARTRSYTCTTTTPLARPRESLPRRTLRFRLLLIRCDSVLSILLSIFLFHCSRIINDDSLADATKSLSLSLQIRR